MVLRPELLQHLNIPKPLHGLNPRNILGQEWWDRQKQQARQIAKDCCAACGVHKSRAKYHKWLETHESFLIDYNKGTLTIVEYVALCHSCHAFIHDGLLNIKLQKGEISQAKFDDIMSHGNLILHRAGIEKPEYPDECNVKWQDWRLIFDGQESKPLWKDYEHWYNHYNKL
jgi:hypothetical protein